MQRSARLSVSRVQEREGEKQYRSDGDQAGANQVNRKRQISSFINRGGASFIPSPRRELFGARLGPRRRGLLLLLSLRSGFIRLGLRSPLHHAPRRERTDEGSSADGACSGGRDKRDVRACCQSCCSTSHGSTING